MHLHNLEFAVSANLSSRLTGSNRHPEEGLMSFFFLGDVRMWMHHL